LSAITAVARKGVQRRDLSVRAPLVPVIPVTRLYSLRAGGVRVI